MISKRLRKIGKPVQQTKVHKIHVNPLFRWKRSENILFQNSAGRFNLSVQGLFLNLKDVRLLLDKDKKHN